MPEGIDVSKHQGTVNWSEVASAGKTFAVSRSSLGQSTHDETFVRNYTRSLANGLVPGAYHVVTGDSSGQQQAANWGTILDAAGFTKGLLVIDVEGWSGTDGYPAATILDNVSYLCQWIRDTYDRTPVIYTGYFWRDYLKNHADAFGSRLWLAAYVQDPTPYVPKAWSNWTVWQYTSSGTVPGITGNVDLNKSSGTLRALKSLAGWEWDELATKEEIRALLREELSLAQAADAASTASILNAIGNLGIILTQEQQSIDTLTDAVAALDATLGEPAGSDPALAELKTLIERLHRHWCLPCATKYIDGE